MKIFAKRLIILFFSVFTLLSFTSCNSDDDEATTIYSYTLETYTNMTVTPNTEGATQATELFLEKDWMMTKAIPGNTLEVSDLSAKIIFQSIVEQANQEFLNIDFHNNTKLTYKLTRKHPSNNSEVEVDVQVWNFIK
ncbi:hypothetical protein SAMN04487911_13241 [Arenibacter nanhaiticus]|uniref:Uncharacterized protein n=1 Tax=Arenibacter nanhaiticus TaxID=558155 RepID=A0A1M6LMK2_9FLAO|nr:hypothetical protein [Arenibacter nanhaiticus]SHJ72394.1 hypothetical protein SAMN04487911_13241 [Arenibacter nanhaiticus]